MEKLDDGAAIACSLNDETFRKRRALARRTILPRINESQRLANGLKLTFAASTDLRKEVETFVDLERQCCGFLSFTVSPKSAGEPVVLTITGPPEAAATVEMFAQAVEARQ